MKKSNLLQLCFVLALVFIPGAMLGPAASNPSTADWQTILQQRLPMGTEIGSSLAMRPSRLTRKTASRRSL